MTREPDRFDKQAREVVASLWPGKQARSRNVELVAAALRQVADEALERAAQIAEGSREDGRCIAFAIRSMKSPAAAPAAEPCRAECASRMPDYSHYECTLPKGHVGPHKEGSFAEWTDATTVVAPPSEPAAPAPDFRALLVEARAVLDTEGCCADEAPDSLCKRIDKALADGGEGT